LKIPRRRHVVSRSFTRADRASSHLRIGPIRWSLFPFATPASSAMPGSFGTRRRRRRRLFLSFCQCAHCRGIRVLCFAYVPERNRRRGVALIRAIRPWSRTRDAFPRSSQLGHSRDGSINPTVVAGGRATGRLFRIRTRAAVRPRSSCLERSSLSGVTGTS